MLFALRVDTSASNSEKLLYFYTFMERGGNKLLAILLCSVVLLATTVTPVSAGFLDTLKEKWNEIKQEYHEVKEHVKEKYKKMKQSWEEKKEQIKQSYEQTKEKIKEKIKKGKQKIQEVKEKVERKLPELEKEAKKGWNTIKSKINKLERLKSGAKEKYKEAIKLWNRLPENVRKDLEKKAVKTGVTIVVASVVGGGIIGAAAAAATSEAVTYVLFDKDSDEVLVYDDLAGKMVKAATCSAITQATHGLVTPESIEDIRVTKTSDGKYEMEIRSTVKLFGLIPVSMDTKIKTDKKDPADVEVELPWWSFLARP